MNAKRTRYNAASEASRQEDYHAELFDAARSWTEMHPRIVDLSGDAGRSGLLGFDQLGHFGPHGCDLVVTQLCALAGRLGRPLELCELGSGFGGALRFICDRVEAAEKTIDTAIGIELVGAHVAIANQIEQCIGSGRLTFLQSDCHSLDLADECLDAVIIVGSMPHFADPAQVFSQAWRVLRAGGSLIFTEEVSLIHAEGIVSARFREYHPAGVFHTTELPRRLEQLAAAGFVNIVLEPHREWAIELLTARRQALKLFRGSAEGIFGLDQVARIDGTLASACDEFVRGTVVPAFGTARKLQR